MARDLGDNITEKESCLSSANEVLAQVIDFLPDATLAINTDGEAIIWNRAMEDLTGVKAKEILGKGNYKYALPFYGKRRPILVDLVLMPEDNIGGKYDKIQRDGSTLTIEIFIPSFSPKGSHLWAKATPLYDSDGKIIGAIESIRDITERKKSDELLRKSEQEKAAILEGLKNVSVEYLDPEMHVVWLSDAVQKHIGLSTEEITGKNCFKIIQGLDEPCSGCTAIKALQTGQSQDGELFTPDGRSWISHSSPIKDNGQIKGVVHVAVNITHRKRIEEALLKSEQEKAAVLGGLKTVAVEYLDPEMRIIWLNDAVLKSLGLSAEDVLGKSCFELIQGLDAPCPGCTAIDAIRTGQSQEGELLTPDGKTWISHSSPIKDLAGNVKGVVHVAVNITQRKRAEEKLANIIDFLPDATFVMDINRKVIAWNRALEELTDVKASEMIGKGDYEYAVPFYGSRRPMLIDLAMMPDVDVDGKYNNLQKEGNTLITEVYIPTFGQGGANLWAKATPLYDTSGKLMGAIESVRDMTLLRRTEKTLERSKAELRIASDIQRSFLPEHIPPFPGFDMAAISIPAMEVGGDFYDFIPGDGKLGMVIADVSGKSIPAALFMALSRTIVRANATHHERGTDVLQEANDMISADSHSGMFVTLFYGVIDQSGYNLVYANAGHPPPILLRGGSDEIIVLDVTGIALGAISGVEYEERKVALSPGDIMILYTDGVTEAINSDVEQYGMKRLCAIAQRYRHLSAQGIIEKILEDISQFTVDQAQFDDITMIIAKAEEDKSKILTN